MDAVKQEVPVAAILAGSISRDPRAYPLQPEDVVPHRHTQRKKKSRYGEKKKKRPIWLTGTCWGILESRHAVYQSHLKEYLCSIAHPDSTECPDCCTSQQQVDSITLSEYIERLVRAYLYDNTLVG
jgi:hypothetical protein